jgi:hypothetical protein
VNPYALSRHPKRDQALRLVIEFLQFYGLENSLEVLLCETDMKQSLSSKEELWKSISSRSAECPSNDSLIEGLLTLDPNLVEISKEQSDSESTDRSSGLPSADSDVVLPASHSEPAAENELEISKPASPVSTLPPLFSDELPALRPGLLAPVGLKKALPSLADDLEQERSSRDYSDHDAPEQPDERALSRYEEIQKGKSLSLPPPDPQMDSSPWRCRLSRGELARDKCSTRRN